jgi:hypothetical protein
MFYAGSSFGLLIFTPKLSTVIYGNDHTLVLYNFIWPSVLIGLRLLVYLTRMHRSVYPSSSSEEESHRRIASECHLEKWAQGSWSWAALSTLWSQFLIFCQSKKTFRTERRRHSKTLRVERRRQSKSYRTECRRHGKSFCVKGKS